MNKNRRHCAWVSGKPEDLERGLLREEFSKFGKTRKIFITEDLSFAKVYFDDDEVLKEACQGLDGYLSWKVKFAADDYKGKETPFNSNFSEVAEPEAKMCDDYNVFESDDYVDLHGNNITVLEGDEGEIFVRLADIKKAGFSVFKKDNYDPLIANRRQILKEFELYLLAEGKKYLLRAQANLQQDEIIRTMENVRKRLLGNDTNQQQSSFASGRVVDQFGKVTLMSQDPPSRPKPKFGPAERNDQGMREKKQFNPRNNTQQNGNARQANGYQGAKLWEQQGARPRTNEGRPPTSSFAKTEPEANWGEESKSKPRNRSDQRGQTSNYSQSVKTEPDENWGEQVKSQPRNRSDQQGQTSNFSQRNPPRQEVVTSEKEESWGREEKPRSESGSVASSRTRSTVVEGLSLGKVTLPIGSVESVCITHVQKRNDNSDIYYVQMCKNEEEVNAILVEASDQYPVQKEVTPEVGLPCLVEYEDIWYRAEVFDANGPIVYLLDYGNREKNITGPLKALPESLSKIPGQAVRITISKDENGEKPNYNLQIDDKISIVAKKQFNDGTYVVEVVTDSVEKPKPSDEFCKQVKVEKPEVVEERPEPTTAPRPEPTTAPRPEPTTAPTPVEEKEVAYFEIPKPVSALQDTEKVMLVAYKNNRLILKTKDCVKQCKEMNAYIESLDKKPIKNVVKDQLVLCSMDGMNGLHRAVVTEITEKVAKVDYLDYFGEALLSVISLRNVDEKLAKMPPTLILSPEFKPLEDIKEASKTFLEDLIEKKTKLNVVLPNKSVFDLQLEEGKLLSDKLLELDSSRKPKRSGPCGGPTPSEPPSREPTPSDPPCRVSDNPKKQEILRPTPSEPAYEIVHYENMEFIPPTLGTRNYMVYSFVDTTQVTLLSTDDSALNYLQLLINLLPDSDVPYKPTEPYEMVLAFYVGPDDEEGSWHRGVFLEIENDLYSILFVDYGNSEKLAFKDLRRFPEKLKNIPILGISAKLLGLENTPPVVNRLKGLLTDGLQPSVKVDSVEVDDDMKYGITMPEIYEKLKEEGLLK